MTASELAQRLERVADRLPQIMLAGGAEAALEGERMAKMNATTLLRVRTGRLRGSVSTNAKITGPDVMITFKAGGMGGRGPVPYGRVQEEGSGYLPGGAITPKRGKFLAIPMGPALTPAGVPRFRSPRDVPGLRFQLVRGGAMGRLVRDVGGRNSRAETWFLLVRRVVLRPRRYLLRARNELEPMVPTIIAEHLRDAILGAA